MTSDTQLSSQNGTSGGGATPRTKICVYCGASAGTNPAHIEAARELARVMAANNIDLGESSGCAHIVEEESQVGSDGKKGNTDGE